MKSKMWIAAKKSYFTLSYLKVLFSDFPLPSFRNHTMTAATAESPKQFSSAISKLIYQYELQTALYMLEPWEKALFSKFQWMPSLTSLR